MQNSAFGFLLFPDLEDLRRLGGLEVVEERFVVDGNIWTSSGVSAGIDLALEL